MSALTLAAFRIGVTVLAVVGALLAVLGDPALFQVGADAGGWSPEQAASINRLFAGIWTVEVLLAATIALTLAWRASHRADARALAWFLAFFTLFNLGDAVRELGLLPAAGAGRGVVWMLDGGTWWLALAAFLRFSALFPRPLTSADLDAAGLAPWRARLLDARVVWGGAALLVPASFALAQLAGGEIGAGGPLTLRLAGFVVLLGLVAGFLWAMVQGVRHLRIRYRSVDAADRRRILWVVQGFVLALWLIVIGLAATLPVALAAIVGSGWIWPLIPILAIAIAPLVIVVFLAVAIFYDGAIDPTLVISRTALYGAFGVVLTFLFAGVENLASSALVRGLGLPEDSAGWIAAGTVGLVFGFARHRLARVIEPIVAPMVPGEEPATGPGRAEAGVAARSAGGSRADVS